MGDRESSVKRTHISSCHYEACGGRGENDRGRIKIAVGNVMRNEIALLLYPTSAGNFIGAQEDESMMRSDPSRREYDEKQIASIVVFSSHKSVCGDEFPRGRRRAGRGQKLRIRSTLRKRRGGSRWFMVLVYCEYIYI